MGSRKSKQQDPKVKKPDLAGTTAGKLMFLGFALFFGGLGWGFSQGEVMNPVSMVIIAGGSLISALAILVQIREDTQKQKQQQELELELEQK